MNWLAKTVTSMTRALGMRHMPGRSSIERRLLKRTRFDYRKEVGDLIDASVVTAPIQFVQRSLPEATLTVRRTKPSGEQQFVPDHAALQLIARPNAFYGDLALWSGTVFSYFTGGNAYWIKLRNGVGRPGELWYVPHWMMEPFGSDDGSVFIERYEYRPGGGEVVVYDPADIVHFRHGIDPRNPRKGLPPLDGVIREIFMDLESSNFVSSLLRNMGVPGMVISPKAGGVVSPDDVDATKTWLRQAFGGDRRGEPLVMGAPTEVTPYGFNPQQLNMSDARDIAEERVCAALGIPAAVVGFGAGLQSTKVGATMTELRKLAWQNGILPVGRVFADELDRSLLPDFGNTVGLNAWWDTSEVQSLQEDRAQAATGWNTMVQGGWAEVYEARDGMGLQVDDSHRIFLRPAMSIEVPGSSVKSSGAGGTKAAATAAQRRAGTGYVRALQRQETALAKGMQKRLGTFFAGMGKAAKVAARPVLEELFVVEPKAVEGVETKADELLVESILSRLGIPTYRDAFRQVYEAQYLDVAKSVTAAAELAGLGGSLPDPVARSIVAAGGRRSGMVDLEKQTRKALFDAVAEGRSQGEGVSALAQRIADFVEAGPWGTIETRAQTIARTETKYAQNVSTIERARAAQVERFIVFDGRLGPGRSKPDHIARDGSIVTADQASQMAADEHPNGTLSFAPYFGEDD